MELLEKLSVELLEKNQGRTPKKVLYVTLNEIPTGTTRRIPAGIRDGTLTGILGGSLLEILLECLIVEEFLVESGYLFGGFPENILEI